MLIGAYSYSLDMKGRVFIPSKWRESIGDTLVVTRGLLENPSDFCLFAMPVPDWDQFSSKLSQLPISDMASQAIRRRIYSCAAACEIDRQGRILLPSSLRESAHICTNVTLIGIGNRIEIWEPNALENHYRSIEESYGCALEHLASIGI